MTVKNLEFRPDVDYGIFKFWWKMIKYKPGLYLVDGIIWLAIHLTPLIPGLIYKELFDTFNHQSKLNLSVWLLSSLILANGALNIILIYFGARVDNLHRFNMNNLLRHNILAAILRKPGAHTISVSSGNIVNCLREDAEQAENTFSWVWDVVGNAMFAIFAFCVLIRINASITLFVFAPLIAVLVITKLVGEKVQKYRKASREATSDVVGALGEVLGAIQAIQVAVAEDSILAHMDSLNRKRHKMMLKDSLFSSLLGSIYLNTVTIGTCIILLLGAKSIYQGTMSVGDFALFVYYIGFVADFIDFFGGFLAYFKQTKVSFARMVDLLQGDSPESLVEHNTLYFKKPIPELNTLSKATTYKLDTLEVKGLTYLYPSSGHGIENVSFKLKSDSFTVITGRVGSGKSTLVKVLLGLLPKDKGEIYWNDKLIQNPVEYFMPPVCAYTPQIPKLISDTVRNNLLLGMQCDEDEINNALYSAVLEQDIENFENKLDTIVGPKGVKLSGGQNQRVAIARMFLRDSDLFVFDDVSSALDVETERSLWNRLSKRRQVACICISNRKMALQSADHIILLKDGHVEAEGNLEYLLENYTEMKMIWGAD